MNRTDWSDTSSYVIYKSGLWQIVRYNHNPDEDLRPQWGWDGDPPCSTWTIRHRFGPKLPDGTCETEVCPGRDDYTFACAMEVLAFAAL